MTYAKGERVRLTGWPGHERHGRGERAVRGTVLATPAPFESWVDVGFDDDPTDPHGVIFSDLRPLDVVERLAELAER